MSNIWWSWDVWKEYLKITSSPGKVFITILMSLLGHCISAISSLRINYITALKWDFLTCQSTGTEIWPLYIYIYIYIYMYIYIKQYELDFRVIISSSCVINTYPWPSLATPPYCSSLLSGPQGYTPYPHRAAVCRFKLATLLLLGHVKGSIEVHTIIIWV